jgi:hypothetical protein
VSDCCLTQTSNFSDISWEQVTFRWDDDDVCFVQDQHDYLDVYSAETTVHR